MLLKTIPVASVWPTCACAWSISCLLSGSKFKPLGVAVSVGNKSGALRFGGWLCLLNESSIPRGVSDCIGLAYCKMGRLIGLEGLSDWHCQVAGSTSAVPAFDWYWKSDSASHVVSGSLMYKSCLYMSTKPVLHQSPERSATVES